MAIHYTSTRTTILNQLAQAGNKLGNVDASGLEGAEDRLAAVWALTAAYQTAISELLQAAGHTDEIAGVCDYLHDLAGDHFHCLTLDVEEAARPPVRDPDEWRDAMQDRQMMGGRVAHGNGGRAA